MSAADGERVVRELGLRTVLPANWATGLAEASTLGVFVTPPIAGWVFAVGADLHGDLYGKGDYQERIPALVQRLSATFGEAAWFLTHDEEEHHGWALARSGQLHRAYTYSDEQGDVLWEGSVTPAERALGCYEDDPRDGSDDEIKWWPDERVVLAMAAKWSIDPSSLGTRALPPSCGWLGRL